MLMNKIGHHSENFTTPSSTSHGARSRSPPIHPERIQFAGSYSSNGERRISTDINSNQYQWPPALLHEEDTDMMDLSDFARRSEAGQAHDDPEGIDALH